MAKRTPIRHGEILLLPVESAPAGSHSRVSSCIVGHSESGHHHVLESDTPFDQIVAANGDLYVDLDAATPLRHRKTFQQHRELTVPAGVWRVIRKTEFDVRAMPEPVDTAAPLRVPPDAETRRRLSAGRRPISVHGCDTSGTDGDVRRRYGRRAGHRLLPPPQRGGRITRSRRCKPHSIS